MKEKFLLGASTAAHQVEGNNIHSDLFGHFAGVAQSAERRRGKAEGTGSIPVSSFFCV